MENLVGGRAGLGSVLASKSSGKLSEPIDGVADITPDDALARDLAVAAGRRLLDLRARHGDLEAAGCDQLRRDGDRLSHEFLAAELARLRPDDAVLSEEGTDSAARLSAGRVWIVDPLDGTREFGEPGRTDWAVHVALWEHGRLTAGAVALPGQGRVLSTAEPPPAVIWPPDPGTTAPRRILVSRSRPPEFVRQLADLLGAVLVPLGSAGAKAAAVILGEADAYVHSGGQFEWDSAAPVAVAQVAGLHACRIDGSELVYNQPVPSVPDILLSPAELAPSLLQAISAVSPAASPGSASVKRADPGERLAEPVPVLPIRAQYPEPA